MCTWGKTETWRFASAAPDSWRVTYRWLIPRKSSPSLLPDAPLGVARFAATAPQLIRGYNELSPDSELVDETLVAIEISCVEIVEQTPTLTDQS